MPKVYHLGEEALLDDDNGRHGGELLALYVYNGLALNLICLSQKAYLCGILAL